ncbi:keratinocyte-associated protein 2 [Holotrichia oblita]|uniref:Keratinocyte-associated protein 2 n=1 Tax=Holotrichia oblita TaxID=644536 RepID=A0ACB9TBD0_HOLOL|nr:keratinocyte-associated protein 2 [Holotrichia oblita]
MDQLLNIYEKTSKQWQQFTQLTLTAIEEINNKIELVEKKHAEIQNTIDNINTLSKHAQAQGLIKICPRAYITATIKHTGEYNVEMNPEYQCTLTKDQTIEIRAKMTVSNQMSFVIASISAVLIFSGMQMYKPWFVASQLNHIVGGYLGSLLFLFMFAAIGNLEAYCFGKSFQAKMFPEVTICFCLALMSTGTIHRVCFTTCILFSLITLYYINSYSQKVHVVPTVATATHIGKKRK